MRHKNSTAIDIGITFITKIVYLIGSFFISILIARLIGPEGKGIIAALFIIPNILISIADLGVRQASAYYIGQSKYKLQDIVSSSLFLWLASSLLTIPILYLFYVLIETNSFSIILILISLLYVPSKILASYFDGILQGLQMIGKLNTKVLIEFISRFSIVIVLVWGLNMGVTGTALATLIPSIVVLVYTAKLVSKNADLKVEYISGVPQDIFKKGIVYAMALFILQLNYKIDIIILDSLVNSADLGIYTVGVTLAELIWQLPAAIGMVLFTRSANSKTDFESTNRSTRLLRITWIPLIIITLIFGAGAPTFVRVLYGPEFIHAGIIIQLLLPGIVSMVMFKILNADLAGRGNPLFGLKIYLVTLLSNIILNLILVPNYGINGAAIASSFSYFLGAILFSIAYHKHTSVLYSSLFLISFEDIKLIKLAIRRRK